MDHAVHSARPRAGRRRHRFAGLALVAILAPALAVLGLASATPVGAAPGDKVLIYFESAGHDPGPPRDALRALATDSGYTPVEDGDSSEFTWTDGDVPGTETAGLGQFKAVIFVHTNVGGGSLSASEKAAFEAFTAAGGGSMFLHYALWSQPNWPFYERLSGAVSGHHPERAGGPELPGSPGGNPGTLGIIQGTVKVYDAASVLTAGLPATATRWDEYYDWRVNPVNTVHTLVEVDERTYSAGFTGRGGLVHPVTWCQAIEGGRQWTTSLGHSAANWAFAYDDFNKAQLELGMQYVVGDLPAPECSVPGKDAKGSWDQGMEWAGVTPWPILPINMALTADGKVQSFGARKPGTGGCVPADPLVAYSLNGNPCAPDQGGQFEFDVWDPSTNRTVANVNDGLLPNTTYTDLFCSIAVLDPTRDVVYTAGGDDSLGGNAPNAGAIGVTSYSTSTGIQDEAPMNFPRWYPTATVMPNGDIVVQGGISSYSGGDPIITPERYSPSEGNGWKVLTGATNADAYSNDQKRWWYPRSWVAPNGKLYTISASKVYEIDPSGDGTLTMLPDLPVAIQNQGELGTPIGSTSTAVMYQPGKILQVGGGSFQNGGGPAAARAGFTVDLNTPGGTANPTIAATQPMRYPRHWANSTILPDGRVLVSGGARQNASGISTADGVAPAPEIWDPATGQWSSDLATYRHGRQYHSSAMLLPDGRVMMGGGGAPGPGPYSDVEFYSPDYLWDGNTAAARPEITLAPPKVAYDSTFQISVDGDVDRVTMLRAGTVTHSFNNGQAFYEPQFSVNGSTVTIQAPADGTIAPPGTWLLYVLNADGTPSVAELVDIDPDTKVASPSPVLVDQFDVPRIASAATIPVAAGGTHLAPWTVTNDVELERAIEVGGLEEVGYRLNLGVDGALNRAVEGFEAGREYRISFKYARQNGVTVPGGAAVAGTVRIGDLDETVTATASDVADGTWGTYTTTFTANSATENLSLAAAVTGTTAGLMIDNLVIFPSSALSLDAVPIHYEFEDDPAATTVANTGTDQSVGAGTFQGAGLGFDPAGVFGSALNLPGGLAPDGNSSPANFVDLPDNLASDAADFTVSFWARPDQLMNWTTMFGVGAGARDNAYFLIQTKTNNGTTGLGASFKLAGSGDIERVVGGTVAKDLTLGQWNHVAFTLAGNTGTLYLNGTQLAQRTDLTMNLPALGATTQNFLGKSQWPDPAYDGLLDDVRVYETALAGSDVTALYNTGTAVATTTSVTTAPASPSAYGAPVTVTATVTDDANAPVTGNAQLTLDGSPVGAPVALAADGTVTWTVGPLAAGDHPVVVDYLGTSGVRSSEGTVMHNVETPGTTGATTTTAVEVTPPSPSAYGGSVTVTATVKDAADANAIGSAELWIDGVKANDAVFLVDGAVAFPPRPLPPGDHTIEVRYSGSRGLQPSTGTTSHTVSPPDPSVAPIHYRFDEASGTTAANSGTDAATGPGALDGQATFSPNGLIGGALNLNGTTNARVNLPDDLASTYADVTVSMWVKPTTQPATWTPLLNIGNGTSDYLLIQAPIGTAPNGISATMKGGGAPDERTSASGAGNNVQAGQWTHIVFTLSGTTGVGTIYLNGQQRGQNTAVTVDMTEVGDGHTVDNWIGDNGYGDPWFNGLIDDVRIYPVAFEAAQVQQIFEERPGAAKPTTTTVTTTPTSPSAAGAPVTVTATVAAQGATPTGQAQLVVDGANVGAPVALAAGTVTFPAQTLAPGDHAVLVKYLGIAGAFVASEALKVHTVSAPDPEPVATTTSVSTSPVSPSAVDTPVTVSATVKDASGSAAPGSAELWIDGAKVGDAVAIAGDGSVTFPAHALALGSHAVVVKYVGATGFLPSEGSATHEVVKKVKPPKGPKSFVDVMPGRLLDTRIGGSTVDNRFAGAGTVGAGNVVTLDVAGRGGIPADATSALLNITAADTGGDGYLTAWPCGTDRPDASSLNYPAGAAAPNAVLARLGAGGSLCLYTSASTELIVDVAGYFPAGAGFESVVPIRVADTRQGERRAIGDVVRIPVRDAAGNVPAPGTAVAVNLTVTGTAGAGYVTVWPCDRERPESSSINYVEGQTVANAVISTVSADGELCAWIGQSATHVVVDLNGLFAPGSDVATHNPERVLDTRQAGGPIAANTTVEVALAGAGLPTGATHALLNVTAVDPAGAGYATVHPCGAPVPNTSNLNFAAGRNAANAVIAPVDVAGNVCLYVAEGSTGLVVDLVGSIADADG